MDFRVKALARMRAPDEIDTPTTLASPRGWIAVFVVAVIVAGAAVWAFAGRLPITVNASGLLSHPQGISVLQSPVGGLVHDIRVAPGAQVSAGQTVADIQAGGTEQPVVSPFGGLVVEVTAATGQVVGAGSTVLTVERTDGPDDRMVALLFVPASAAAELAPGMKANISVSSAPSAAFGLLQGQVAAVSQYPLDPASLNNLLGGDPALSGYTSSGAPWLVTVDLTPRAGNPSGFAWTSAEGPPESLHSLTSVTATVSLGSQSPVSFVLGD
jgi:biotin carboxyl carrier protein